MTLTHTHALRKSNIHWARSNQKRAPTTFAEHLETRFQPNPGTKHSRNSEQIYEDKIPLFRPGEVTEEIPDLDAKKAHVFDLITGEILKKLQRKGLIKLTTPIISLKSWPWFLESLRDHDTKTWKRSPQGRMIITHRNHPSLFCRFCPSCLKSCFWSV